MAQTEEEAIRTSAQRSTSWKEVATVAGHTSDPAKTCKAGEERIRSPFIAKEKVTDLPKILPKISSEKTPESPLSPEISFIRQRRSSITTAPPDNHSSTVVTDGKHTLGLD
jgi:hypothetical protein